MSYTATVIEDSISRFGIMLRTVEARYPRFIHAEFMTHRVFSRNASSSRATPTKRLIKSIRQDPAMPIHWGQNQAGMQAQNEVAGWRAWVGKFFWLTGMWIMTSIALFLNFLGIHKQVVNRLVEPWSHITVVMTATDWDNFFKLRIHPDAQPEMRKLAETIKAALDASTPVRRQYHLPYVTQEERDRYQLWENQKLSTARCARTSYLTHERQTPKFGPDLELAGKLLAAGHWSPFEHQAVQSDAPERRYNNFQGWIPQRYEMEQAQAI